MGIEFALLMLLLSACVVSAGLVIIIPLAGVKPSEIPSDVIYYMMVSLFIYSVLLISVVMEVVV